MGGDEMSSHNCSPEDGSSLDLEFPEQSPDLPELFGSIGFRNSLTFEANQKRMRTVYAEVLASYDESQRRSLSLEEAKGKILSYTPGSWIENVGGLKLADYLVPETTSLLLIGPKGSGKSSLVNKISRVFDNDKFVSERAQVSYNSSFGEGTYFLQEYMIPRGSNSLCLYDTRSLSNDMTENTKMLEWWMTKGVRHGELIKRASDGANLDYRMKCKARQIGRLSGKVRVVNFVIMVVNGLSVLESMDGDDEGKKQYTEMLATTFSSPFLSFKDDKPVVVVTHGDLLTLSDRVRIRVYLGDLLGIPPKTQIFDIPENNDLVTELTIVDLLCHCLEHADRDLPLRSGFMSKMDTTFLPIYFLMLMVLGIGIIFAFMHCACVHKNHKSPTPSEARVDWHTIRHLWLDEN